MYITKLLTVAYTVFESKTLEQYYKETVAKAPRFSKFPVPSLRYNIQESIGLVEGCGPITYDNLDSNDKSAFDNRLADAILENMILRAEIKTSIYFEQPDSSRFSDHAPASLDNTAFQEMCDVELDNLGAEREPVPRNAAAKQLTPQEEQALNAALNKIFKE